MLLGMTDSSGAGASQPRLSDAGRIVQRHDPDRFLTALFAPAARREALFVLYAVNHELARAREAASNPMLALIRLQWWREVAEGARRRHEVAGPLGEALDGGRLHAADILGMIEGREAEAGEIEDVPAFRAYVLAAYGGVAVAAGRALGLEDGAGLDALRSLGAAYGVSGVLRSVAALARQERCLLPLDLLGRVGLGPSEVIADPADGRLAPIRAELTGIGQEMLGAGRALRLPRPALAAALPAVLARRDLGQAGPPAGPRGAGSRLAVLWAAVSGRV